MVFASGFGRVEKLTLSRNTKGLLDGWFCDYIIIQDPRFSHLKKHRKIKNYLAPGTVTSIEDSGSIKVSNCIWILCINLL